MYFIVEFYQSFVAVAEFLISISIKIQFLKLNFNVFEKDFVVFIHGEINS